ncbi:MAG: hypothetical protein DMD83_21740 [Candidatus Rokuibacteriota bacterium]|nr:MAG: hypothetical protein DMD83_21740 [Candidatus Rokubacteria bacterium]
MPRISRDRPCRWLDLCGTRRNFVDSYQPGNCAHGVGHAILILSGYDLGEALKHCAAFESAPLTYYCATGVFMENAINPGARDRNTGSLH